MMNAIMIKEIVILDKITYKMLGLEKVPTCKCSRGCMHGLQVVGVKSFQRMCWLGTTMATETKSTVLRLLFLFAPLFSKHSLHSECCWYYCSMVDFSCADCISEYKSKCRAYLLSVC